MIETLRYAEGPSSEVCRLVKAAPAIVWELVSDIALPTRFSPELRTVEWLDAVSEASLGARFRGVNERDGIGRWEVTCEITGFEPEALFEWSVLGADAVVATWRFVLEPVGDDTMLWQSCRLGPGRSKLSELIDRMPEREEQLVRGRLAELAGNMQRNLDGIATALETPSRLGDES